MTERIIQMVSVLDLMRALEGSVDEAWNADENWLVDLYQRKLESVLYDISQAKKLLDGEEQRYPIVVCVNGNDFYCEGKKWILGNGNHRFATLIAMCAEEVMVVFNESETEYMCSDVSGGW